MSAPGRNPSLAPGPEAVPPAPAPDPFRWLAGAALAALAVGLLFSAHSLATLSADLYRIQRRAADVATLRRLEAGWRSEQQAVQQFEQLRTRQPASLAELVAKYVPSGTHALRLRESVPAAAGWTLRRAEVKLETIRLAELTALLASAERGRPPWRLAEFDLAATDAAGIGRATLVFEALEKKDAAAPAAPAPATPVVPLPAAPASPTSSPAAVP